MFIFNPEDLLKILLAVVIGGVIGMERELHSKAAGLRTITLITLGATLFTIISSKLGTDRIAANIVSGIGFLGAGVILFAEGRLKGLTTSASIWAAAAVGMAIGQGEYILSFTVTVVVVMVLGLFPQLDHLLDRFGRETRTYEMAYGSSNSKRAELDAFIRKNKLKLRSHKEMKKDGQTISIWEVEGHAKQHAAWCEKLLDDVDIRDLKY
jgi:putative Mg2+ transporter-C (MgtC) family protein